MLLIGARFRAESLIRCLSCPPQSWYHAISQQILRLERPAPRREAPGKLHSNMAKGMKAMKAMRKGMKKAAKAMRKGMKRRAMKKKAAPEEAPMKAMRRK